MVRDYIPLISIFERGEDLFYVPEWPLLVNSPCVLEKNVYPASVGCRVLYMSGQICSDLLYLY